MTRPACILAPLVAAALALPFPARAEQFLPQGRITAGNDILFGALKLGKRVAGRTTLTPDAIDLGPGLLARGGQAPIDLALAGDCAADGIRAASGIAISHCAPLARLVGPPDGSIDPAYFDHVRSSLFISAHTRDDGHSQENLLSLALTAQTGERKTYTPNTAYALGDNVHFGNAIYRATRGGTTGANSAPPALATQPNSLPFVVQDGTVQWTWISAQALFAVKQHRNGTPDRLPIGTPFRAWRDAPDQPGGAG